MPFVDVKMWKGIDQKKIEYGIENNYLSLCMNMDVPADAVKVIIQEIPKSMGAVWKTCALRSKDIEPYRKKSKI